VKKYLVDISAGKFLIPARNETSAAATVIRISPSARISGVREATSFEIAEFQAMYLLQTLIAMDKSRSEFIEMREIISGLGRKAICPFIALARLKRLQLSKMVYN
jgi:hypothetical protein